MTTRNSDGALSTLEPDAVWLLASQRRGEDDQPRESRIRQLRQTLSGALSQVGVEAFCYQIIRGPSIMPRIDSGACLISTCPGTWNPRIALDERPETAPFLARALKSQLPFRWDKFIESDVRAPERSDPADDRFADERITTYPIHTECDIAALTTVTKHEHNDSADEFIFLIGHYFHAVARRVLMEGALTASRRRVSLLSPRETQMLELTAKGMITSEISKLVGIAPKSVETHIESARKKLHAANRTHAVVKSLLLGVVSPDMV